MIKHFKWRLVFDGEKLPVKVGTCPQIDVDEAEINYLDGKCWIPGKGNGGSLEITLFEPHDLWQGSKDVVLHFLTMLGEDLEYWTLKDATQDGVGGKSAVISYKTVYYETAMSKKEKKKVPPREVPGRDDYYMGLAFWVASKSKDPNTQVGSILIGSDNSPISSGYNGPPSTIPDDFINWDRPFKYDMIRHSESNAIRYAAPFRTLSGATLYVTAPPCKRCMLEIASENIKRVVYFPIKKVDAGSSLSNTDDWNITIEIAKLAVIDLIEFNGNLNWMRDRLAWMENIGVFA